MDDNEEDDDVEFAGTRTSLMFEDVDLDGYGSDFGCGSGSMPELAAFERKLFAEKTAAKKSSKKKRPSVAEEHAAKNAKQKTLATSAVTKPIKKSTSVVDHHKVLDCMLSSVAGTKGIVANALGSLYSKEEKSINKFNALMNARKDLPSHLQEIIDKKLEKLLAEDL